MSGTKEKAGSAGEIPVIEVIDREEAAAEAAQDVSAYFEMVAHDEQKELAALAARAASNVVPIRGEVIPAHTDDELVPLSPADVLYERLVFSPERELEAAAHEAWLIDDLLPARGIAFVYGPPGSYKSFVAMDLACSIASGKDWHGIECEMPGGVLYIAAEGARGLMERNVAWKRHYQREVPHLAIMKGAVMMDEVLSVQALIECLERAREAMGVPIRMLVIDTMARSFSGDENSAQEVGAFVNACGRVAAAIEDCLVLVVTHTGKDLTRGMRGSSALDGAADCHFLVTKPNAGQALVKNTKQKDIEMAEPMRFAMESVSIGIKDRKGRTRHSLVPILESKGEDADPDADLEMDAFDAKDLNAMAGMVRAAENAGKKITEDDLRKEFIDWRMAESGNKPDTARKSWQRTYKKARETGRIMKAGAYLHIPSGAR